MKAITFDFWDTLAHDDSDEPKRVAAGVPPKEAARLALFVSEIQQHHDDISKDEVEAAFRAAQGAFQQQWKVRHRTPSVEKRFLSIFSQLRIDPTPGYTGVVEAIEQMEVQIQPDPVEGIQDVLRALSQDYKLGIISDTIHTPGAGLRKILESFGVLEFFSFCAFSDEVGASKPDQKIFWAAAEGLKSSFDEMIHVGDRESNDILGPRQVGMKSILFTGAEDRGSDKTQADAVCKEFKELPDLVTKLFGL